MEEYKHSAHHHPLLLLNEHQISKLEAECWMCGEKASRAGPCFGCHDCPDFFLHKVCADAPSEIDHPFHHDHPLLLLHHSPYSEKKECICDFCDKTCKKSIYHCSCKFDFHIKCALFTYNIAQNNLKELQHVAVEDPLISTENDGKQLEDLRKCFICWEPLADYTYFSPDCGFNLHKKCAELPFIINDICHRKHPLTLQFYANLPCKTCHRTPKLAGLVYGCLPCKFVVHIECSSLCSSLPPVIEDKSHQHSFTPFRRRAPFFCDACGNEGNSIGYICYACNIIVHTKCTSLPRIIKSKYHPGHLIFHYYFLEEDDFKSWDCTICNKNVKAELGSFSCLDCKMIFHVNCVTDDENSYFAVENEDENFVESSITDVIQRNDAGEATEIKHLMHGCYLLLRDKIEEYDKSCDGCMLPISDSYYYCGERCDFCLHKACAELPKSMLLWYHDCRQPLVLTSDSVFTCRECDFWSNAFAYKCMECEHKVCLRCVNALTPGVVTCSKHQHPLFYYKDYKGQCSACGLNTRGAFHCEDCQGHFALDHKCFSLPTTARHKCDEHLLKLTYHEENLYPESHFCDICENFRDPERWFYRCATCETCVHVDCVLGLYRFFILGGSWHFPQLHPHRLTLVKKMYYYPDCAECSKPCLDWAYECNEPGCNYITHLKNC